MDLSSLTDGFRFVLSYHRSCRLSIRKIAPLPIAGQFVHPALLIRTGGEYTCLESESKGGTRVVRVIEKGQVHEAVVPESVARFLPPILIREAEKAAVNGRIEEIRLRAQRKASVVTGGENRQLPVCMSYGEIREILTAMSGKSLYAYSDTINQGYLSLDGGVRVGVGGRASCEENRVIGIYDISSLCIRLPHRASAVGGQIASLLVQAGGSRGVLIYAPPGVGKTTLLRGVATNLAGGDHPLRVVVIDTRGELGFATDGENLCLDVLSGYPRKLGVEIAARCMNAQVMICDEIGDYEEAFALVAAHNCGVPLVASAHGRTAQEILRRTGIRLLHEAKIFAYYVGIERNGSGGFRYRVETWESADALV